MQVSKTSKSEADFVAFNHGKYLYQLDLIDLV